MESSGFPPYLYGRQAFGFSVYRRAQSPKSPLFCRVGVCVYFLRLLLIALASFLRRKHLLFYDYFVFLAVNYCHNIVLQQEVFCQELTLA